VMFRIKPLLSFPSRTFRLTGCVAARTRHREILAVDLRSAQAVRSEPGATIAAVSIP